MTGRPPIALVVEDAPDTRVLLGALAKQAGFRVLEAEDGAEGLATARDRRPHLILLDVRMPNMDGMEALAEIRAIDTSVSVVIVSSDNDPETMERALRLGAVNYLSKPVDHDEVRFVLDRVYSAIEEEADVLHVLDTVQERVTRLNLPGDPGALRRVVAYLGRELKNHYPGYEVPVTEIKLALYEALANAFEHGNLEITYTEKSDAMDQPGGIHGLIESRRNDERLGARRIHVEADYLVDRVAYRVRDEGPGFDVDGVINRPMAASTALHGRGITLIRHYMDEVEWSDQGNEIRLVHRLVKRGERSAEAASGGSA